ncbi:MAG: aminotransferase class IV family protein [Kiloniellaceae bacterium]
MESPLRELAPANLRVIETLGYGTESAAPEARGFRRLALHLDRAARTCARLGIPFDRRACEAALEAAVRNALVSPPTGASLLRCRLTVDLEGRIEAGAAPAGAAPARWRVSVSESRLEPGDPWLSVKTSQRRLYEAARAGLPPGVDEVLFLNTRSEVCEGAITNVFIRRAGSPRQAPLLTPPLSSGLLPGILREELVQSGAAVEEILTLEALRQAEAIFFGNSLRGLIPAEIV